MNKPLVSIIIPFYNTGDTLVPLLKKLLVDKYQNLEIICIDDLSSDDSYVAVKNFCKHEKRVILLQNPHNGGASSARNLGLAKASGDYVCFIDSDDEVSPNFISDLVAQIEKSNSVLTVCGFCQNYLHSRKKVYKFTDEAPARLENERLKDYVLRTMSRDARLYSGVNKIYRGDIIRRYKIRFDEDIDFAEDTKFVLEYLGHCKDKDTISYVPKPHYIYNYGTTTSTIANSSLLWRNWLQSYTTIRAWYGKKKSFKTRINFFKLLLRFKISHALAVARSPLVKNEKKKFATGLELFLASIILKLKK